MYDPKLKVFIEVADCGSFTQAAERLYLSPTGVMKQMNLLESHIGLPLLERTRQGVSLTAAGSSIYQDAKALFQWSDEAIQRVRQAQGIEQRTVRIGTSTLYPGMRLMELWGKVSDSWPMFRLKMVPFPDDPTLMFSDLGRRYDLFCGIYDSDLARHLCRFLPLGQDYFGLAMSRRHPLAERKHLSIGDLSGRHLLIMPGAAVLLMTVSASGWSKTPVSFWKTLRPTMM